MVASSFNNKLYETMMIMTVNIIFCLFCRKFRVFCYG